MSIALENLGRAAKTAIGPPPSADPATGILGEQHAGILENWSINLTELYGNSRCIDPCQVWTRPRSELVERFSIECRLNEFLMRFDFFKCCVQLHQTFGHHCLQFENALRDFVARQLV